MGYFAVYDLDQPDQNCKNETKRNQKRKLPVGINYIARLLSVSWVGVQQIRTRKDDASEEDYKTTYSLRIKAIQFVEEQTV